MSKDEEAIKRLQRAYQAVQESNLPNDGLNTVLRKALRTHAASARLQFAQDNVGNIYITRRGRDSNLAGIAITYPLDNNLDSGTFESAIRIFTTMATDDLLCDLILLGWTATRDRIIGYEKWVSMGSTALAASEIQLQQFSELVDVSACSVSAIFEICESADSHLNIRGSPILVEKVKTQAHPDSQAEFHMKQPLRAPEVSIKGLNAEKVARASIKAYSEYISALFDNFD